MPTIIETLYIALYAKRLSVLLSLYDLHADWFKVAFSCVDTRWNDRWSPVFRKNRHHLQRLEVSTTWAVTAGDTEVQGMIHLQNVDKQLPELCNVATQKTKIHHLLIVQTFQYGNVPETI